MNEVKASQTVVKQTAVASSAGTERNAAKADVVGLPTTEVKSQKEQVVAVEKDSVQQAVTQMNEYVQNEKRDLRFSVDDVTGSTVIRVTSSTSGELIRQIPDETFLKLAQEAKKNEDLQLINIQA